MIGPLLALILALIAVPAAALLLQAWFDNGRWASFNASRYFLAWAIVAGFEIVGLLILTGEPMSVLMVGLWSTVGAGLIGLAWWKATSVNSDEMPNG